MRPKRVFYLGSFLLTEKPLRKKLTKSHRKILDEVGVQKAKGGRKKRPEWKLMLVLTTIEIAHAHGHPLTLSESRVKNPDRKKSAFVLASELTGVTPEAARNIYKTRSKKILQLELLQFSQRVFVDECATPLLRCQKNSIATQKTTEIEKR